MRSRNYFQWFASAMLILLMVLAACSSPEADGVPDPTAEPTASEEMTDHTHEPGMADDHSHDEVIEIGEGKVHPTIALVVHEDPMMGWNFLVETTNFTFSPENASREHALGEGHAHIYVDGVKLGRLYGNWFHLAKLEPGTRNVTVSLNGNNHAAYYYAGQPIEDNVTIEVAMPAEDEMGMGYPAGGDSGAEMAYPMDDDEMAHTDSEMAYPMTDEGHKHDEDAAPHTHMHGEAIDIPEGKTHPTIELMVHPDPKMGWNFEVQTSNFTFSPQNASRENVLGEGHAHIYVDGVKLGRLYTNWFHIAKLEPGEHVITVSLNGNNHAPYYYAGMPLEAAVTVQATE